MAHTRRQKQGSACYLGGAFRETPVNNTHRRLFTIDRDLASWQPSSFARPPEEESSSATASIILSVRRRIDPNASRSRFVKTDFHSSSVRLASRRRNKHAPRGWVENVFRDIFVKTNDTRWQTLFLWVLGYVNKPARIDSSMTKLIPAYRVAVDYFFTSEVSNFGSFVYLKRKIKLECYRMISRQH